MTKCLLIYHPKIKKSTKNFIIHTSFENEHYSILHYTHKITLLFYKELPTKKLNIFKEQMSQAKFILKPFSDKSEADVLKQVETWLNS